MCCNVGSAFNKEQIMHKPPTSKDLIFDREHIWHPYTSMAHPMPTFAVTHAEGVRLYLNDGRSLIDGMSSWWSAIHGYNHPAINQAISAQSSKMSHVMFGGLTHQPAINLCKTLIKLTPTPLQMIFLADSGSISVEVALKMALQYWQGQHQTKKNKFLTVYNGYHGDTLGAMSVCDPINGMHHLFAGVLAKQFFVEAPACSFHSTWQDHYINQMATCLRENHQHIAAVIIEPIVQGAGGMRFYSPVYLQKLRELCDHHNVLLIFDEIATGFGRTGHFFASDLAEVSPDIMCLGKALTAGYMTLAATLCTKTVCQNICEQGPLMHGPTFMANPIACSVANASLEILQTGQWQGQVAQLEEGLRTGLVACGNLSNVIDVRVLGGIGVVQMKKTICLKTWQPRFVERGIWVRPFGKLIYVMPPYIISQQELLELTTGIYEIALAMSKT